ncbi:hypothetical protein [Tessaracoccus oleiagri]|uniref:Uncharacterized protein n=1 Tax=Tessaracoccus oleiagri TaxID=686624 RepID=A0A1G9K0B2_9ACTN|nr:hypothetical protein [Tessaracoccus oleiagri]SDL43287.1 hypothetical protein SAMN04488242_1573 [Tessaracoccus oleiagri]
MSDPADFAAELGRALTGETLPLTSPLLEDLVGDLRDLGWGAEQLGLLRQARQESGEPWPFPVRRDVVAEVGFAVFHARLAALRDALGLTGLQTMQRASRALTAEERRLAADRPPHWG